ncbi:MAG: hypothetical protein V4697_00775 [Patescibacteria group bacterium]
MNVKDWRVKIPGCLLALLLSVVCAVGATVQDYADKIAPLIDPAKLAELRERGANQRVQKITYYLYSAKKDRLDATAVARAAVKDVRMKKAAGDLTVLAMMRNVRIAEQLGCTDAAGLSEMRKGNAATVRFGPYAGDQLSVDHIIPFSVVPELDKVIANLELMPSRMNSKKSASVGQRQRDLATKLNKAGLLSDVGLRAVASR